ncbi:GNAT family N-acetyltransferase [Lucifera butyrica]|uniref:GNAT family N-acetyltransferase n=1 Tax=Lucifera butyrica TaxID=1351585 RepID=UPI001A9CEE5C|nr:GNAT family N-acetyltransferase [Lucifera butyrica]
MIRTGALPDIDKLTDLLRVLFTIETDFVFDAEQQRRGLELILKDNTRGCLLVAEVEQEIIGMCTAQLLVSTAAGGMKALVEDLVVAERYRSKGVGKQLLQAIEMWAVSKGAKRLDLLADRSNTPALEFYRQVGWQTTELICLQRKIIKTPI